MISKKNLEILANTSIPPHYEDTLAGQEAIAKGLTDFYEDYYGHKN